MNDSAASLVLAQQVRDIAESTRWDLSATRRLMPLHIAKKIAADARRMAPILEEARVALAAGPAVFSDEIPVFNMDPVTARFTSVKYDALARAAEIEREAQAVTEEQVNAAVSCFDPETSGYARDEMPGPQIDPSQMDDSDEMGAPVGEFADYFAGEADFLEICTRETGRILSVEAAEERWAAFNLQCQQTERFADALESTGWRVRCVDPSQAGAADSAGRPVRPALTFIPVGQPEKAVTMPNVQRLNAFPTVGASRRAEPLRALRYWLERHPFTRMATLTAGTRFRADSRLENLNAENKRFHRAIGELIRAKWFKRHARAYALGMEFGTPAPMMGTWHLHHHGHLLWEPVKGGVSRLRWSRLRRWVRLKLAALMHYEWTEKGFCWRERERGIWAADELHCELGTIIKNAAEVCKYPLKPADLDVLLNEAGPQAVRTFFKQVKGLRLFTPYGDFRKLRAEVRDAGKRFVSISTPEGKVIEIRRNWNLSRWDFIGRKRRAAERARNRRAMRPEVAEARRKRDLRRFGRKMRRPLWRLFRLSERENEARREIAAGNRPAHFAALLAGYQIEKREHFRFIREVLETCPVSMHQAGISDQIAAPWLADLRAFLADSGTFTAVACTDHQEDAENAKQTAKNGEDKAASKPLRNHVLARCSPFASGKWRVQQPVLAVVGFAGNFGELRTSNPRVAALADATADHIAAALRVADALDAMPAITRAPYTREHAHGRGRAPLRGPHYPHNSKEVSEPWPETPDFWPDEAEKMAFAGTN